MAAGLGFKDFVTGEVLTAADVDGYLMQGVWVFASAAARDAAVTSPQEGNFAYLKDTNVTTYYTGSAWANLDTTGMTNPMTTTGDTIYSSSGSTPARLGIGSTGNVLTVAGGVPTWAAPAGGGGMTLINSGGTTLTGSSVTISSIPSTYVDLHLYIVSPVFDPASYGYNIQFRFNGDTASNYATTDTTFYRAAFGSTVINLGPEQGAGSNTTVNAVIPYYAQTGIFKSCRVISSGANTAGAGAITSTTTTGFYSQTGAITSISLSVALGSFTSGTAYLYGVK